MKAMPDTSDGMEELYSGGSEPGANKAGSVDQANQEDNESEGVAPMKVLQGATGAPLKVGDEVVVKITGVHGDEVTFAYSKTKPGEIPSGDNTKEGADKEIDELDKEY